MTTSVPTYEEMLELVERLVKIRGAELEMNLWLSLYKAMTDEEKLALHSNLTQELEELKKHT
jgi:hypothetical protein